MFKLSFFLLFISVISFAVENTAITFSGDPTEVEMAGQTIKVYPKATAVIDGKEVAMRLTGFGELKRQWTIFVIPAALIASYVDEKTTLDKTKPLDGIKTSQVKLIRLVALASLPDSQIKTDYRNALKKNGVSLETKQMKNVFAESYAVDEKDEALLIGVNLKEDNEYLEVQFPDKHFVREEGKAIGTDFLKAWFGIPLDKYLDALKKELIGKG